MTVRGDPPQPAQLDLAGAGFTRIVGERPEDDFLQTPREFADAVMVRAIHGTGSCTVLDACAGLGVLGLSAEARLRELGRSVRVTAVEKNADRLRTLPESWEGIPGDFLAWSEANQTRRFDLVVMNPPFAYPPATGMKRPVPMWTPFALAALSHRAPGGIVIIVAKVGFLFGAERESRMYRLSKPATIYAPPSRQDYQQGLSSGSGTDFESVAIKWGPTRSADRTEWIWLWGI